MKNVTNQVANLYGEFKTNIQTRQERRTDAWAKRMQEYNARVNVTLFDISTSDESRCETLASEHGFKVAHNFNKLKNY